MRIKNKLLVALTVDLAVSTLMVVGAEVVAEARPPVCLPAVPWYASHPAGAEPGGQIVRFEDGTVKHVHGVPHGVSFWTVKVCNK